MKNSIRVPHHSDPFPIELDDNKNEYNTHPIPKGKISKNIARKKQMEDRRKKIERIKKNEKLTEEEKNLKTKELKKKKLEQSTDEWWKEDSAKRKDGNILDKPIQIYRMWFLFLKFALELESKGVTLVLKQSFSREEKLTGFDKEPKQLKLLGGGDNSYTYPKETFKIKVDRKKYLEWDLDQVLKGHFDPWWDEHKSLFQDEGAVVLNSPDEWVDKQFYEYVRIDTRRRESDTVKDVKEILKERDSKKEVQSQFPIHGRIAVGNLLNYYNALILRLSSVMSAEDILSHENEYIRPSEDSRVEGERFKVPVVKGKKQFSNRLGDFVDKGKDILLNVCDGHFTMNPKRK